MKLKFLFSIALTLTSFFIHGQSEALLKASNYVVCDGPSLSVVENTLVKNRSQLIRIPLILCAKNYLSIDTINQFKHL